MVRTEKVSEKENGAQIKLNKTCPSTPNNFDQRPASTTFYHSRGFFCCVVAQPQTIRIAS